MVFSIKSFTPDYISYDDLRKKADEFRKEYWPEDTIPVDVIDIAEIKLRLYFVPIENLFSDYDTMASISVDGKTIHIDNDMYFSHPNDNRLRFTIAHELGHLILHHRFPKLRNINDWRDFHQQISEKARKRLDYQADEFAGRLLVPINHLKEKLNGLVQEGIASGIDKNTIVNSGKEFISSRLCGHFGVCNQALQIRLDKEKLWPPKI